MNKTQLGEKPKACDCNGVSVSSSPCLKTQKEMRNVTRGFVCLFFLQSIAESYEEIGANDQ